MDLGYSKIWFVNYLATSKIESCQPYTNKAYANLKWCVEE
jgi:hypothetical protein